MCKHESAATGKKIDDQHLTWHQIDACLMAMVECAVRAIRQARAEMMASGGDGETALDRRSAILAEA